MDLFSPRHLLIILVIVLLVFGTKKLKTIGSDLGSAVRGFKKSMNEGDSEESAKQLAAQNAAQGTGHKPDAEFPEVAGAKPKSGPDA